MEGRYQKLKRFAQARFSAKGFPGLYLSLALLVLIAATWIFGAIAEDVVTNDQITVIDARFSAWLQAHANAPLTTIMLGITHLHATIGITIMALAVGAFWWLRHLRYWVLTLMLSVFGGMLLNFLLKNLFLRPRPHLQRPLVTLTGYGFPSGHTMGATVFYGTLCVFVLARVQARHWRVLALLIFAVMIALVGLSRIYLGAHYLSDVLAAMAEGSAWVAFCLIAVDTMRRVQRRREHQPRDEKRNLLLE